MSRNDLPTFLIIGASKCGTTSLGAYLDAHPQIGMAKPKELNYFSFHWNQALDGYKARFASLGKDIRGEASTSYTRAPLISGVPERIAKVIPDARLIYLMRNPIERMRSEYIDQLHGGRERAPTLEKAIWENPRYLSVSRYGYQIELYLNYFARDQLMLVTAEALKSDRVRTIQRILSFLGADPHVLPPNLDVQLNQAATKSRIPPLLDPLRTAWSWARPLTGRIPRSWRMRVRSRLGRDVPASSTHLSSQQKDRVWQMLATDQERLQAIVGADQPLWGPEPR